MRKFLKARLRYSHDCGPVQLALHYPRTQYCRLTNAYPIEIRSRGCNHHEESYVTYSPYNAKSLIHTRDSISRDVACSLFPCGVKCQTLHSAAADLHIIPRNHSVRRSMLITVLTKAILAWIRGRTAMVLILTFGVGYLSHSGETYPCMTTAVPVLSIVDDGPWDTNRRNCLVERATKAGQNAVYTLLCRHVLSHEPGRQMSQVG